MKPNEHTNSASVPRPPIVVVMGHIDHGKSTLLDYIRKTNVVEREAGGITQHISAYEVTHKDEKGAEQRITFLDTPGHEAFSKMRARGAEIADVAILVVSAEDSVKSQTIEAWKTIVESKLPVIVAINKIDKPGANVEKTKMDLAENEIYLENFGGKIPFAEISAKTGQGVDNLLSLVGIMAELENFQGDPSAPASGLVIEADLDPKRGMEATLVIKNGTLKKGDTVVVEDSLASTRIMENFLGKMIPSATFSSPIRIVGFDRMPRIGAAFRAYAKKDAAAEAAEDFKTNKKAGPEKSGGAGSDRKIIPVVLKADVWGSIEAIEKEVGKLASDTAEFRLVARGVGPIGESDIKQVGDDAIVIGFNVKADRGAAELAMARNMPIQFFDIIYKMTEWLAEEMDKRKPKIETVEIAGRAKILKTFSRSKERQIAGGRVTEGRISVDVPVKIMRRDFEIGRGRIVNLEKGKSKASDAAEGDEFGMMIESKIEVAPGDMIESFSVRQK